MNRIHCAWALAIACSSLLGERVLKAADDVPVTYRFLQQGFAEGATVSGTFSGLDRDGNGILVHFPLQDDLPPDQLPPFEFEELVSFHLEFSGNSLAPAFSLTLDDLFGFVFEIQTGSLGDGPAFDPALGMNLTEGIGVIGSSYYYAAGQGPTNTNGGYVGDEVEDPTGDFVGNALDSSVRVVQVTRVPEPAAGLLLLCGLGVASRFRR